MQNKITLEDHFAIEATLGDSQVFGAHVWPELATACSTSRTPGCARWIKAASKK